MKMLYFNESIKIFKNLFFRVAISKIKKLRDFKKTPQISFFFFNNLKNEFI